LQPTAKFGFNYQTNEVCKLSSEISEHDTQTIAGGQDARKNRDNQINRKQNPRHSKTKHL